MGFKMDMEGQPLVAMIIPMIEASPSWTVVSLLQVLAAEMHDTIQDLCDAVSLNEKTRSAMFAAMGQ